MLINASQGLCSNPARPEPSARAPPPPQPPERSRGLLRQLRLAGLQECDQNTGGGFQSKALKE